MSHSFARRTLKKILRAVSCAFMAASMCSEGEGYLILMGS